MNYGQTQKRKSLPFNRIFFIFPLKLWMFITFLGFIRICGCLLGVYENMCVNGTKKHSGRVKIHNIHTYTHTHTPKRNDDKMSNTKQEIENDLLLLFLLLRTITYRVSVFIFRKKLPQWCCGSYIDLWSLEVYTNYKFVSVRMSRGKKCLNSMAP